MTHPNRLTIPVCDPESLKPDLDEVGLVCAPEKIFDALQFTGFLNNCYSEAPDLKIFRDHAVAELRRIRKAGMDEIASSFSRSTCCRKSHSLVYLAYRLYCQIRLEYKQNMASPSPKPNAG